MARTGNNIYKRKDGRYEGRILVGRNSRRKPKYIYIYAKTLREVKRKMSEARIDRLDAEQGEPDISVQTAAEEWVRTTKKKWKPTTLRMYQSIVSRYAIPILGGLSVLKITDETLAEFAESLDEYSDKNAFLTDIKNISAALYARSSEMRITSAIWNRKFFSFRNSRFRKKSYSSLRNRI